MKTAKSIRFATAGRALISVTAKTPGRRARPATALPAPILVLLSLLAFPGLGASQEPDVASLPKGVSAVWDLAKAARETTPTRERICLNGLWRWQPGETQPASPPSGKWGFFKVPGSWPGVTDYLQKDCQTVFAHPAWRSVRLGGISTAWYQREFSVPNNWSGRRVFLQIAYLNSYAKVFIDGQTAGELRFPGGELELTTACQPGQKHVLSLCVVALPLQGVMLSYTDSASARQVKGSVARRGLCGDIYLVSGPSAGRISDVRISTSTRRWQITFDAALQGLESGRSYRLVSRVTDGDRQVAEFASQPFQSGDLKDGRVAYTAAWKPDKLWDVHTPQNTYRASVVLEDATGAAQDAAWRERVGFREFWIDGRDFYLNGTRIFLSCVPLDNAHIGAAWANYEGARESLRRLQSIGINFVYTHNYGCEPGAHLGFEEILRAADDVGMLVSFSQPHFSHYDWKMPNADQANGYARHAEFYVRAAQHHPSVVFYSMSHNATGYAEDMNPFMIDGLKDPRDTWAANNTKLALRAEAIVRRLDPDRIVYHHASGNLGTLHASNFYPNFVPIQELSDWFEHWATVGVKPMFTCEYGGPFTWDWAMYRGWYKGERTFGSARVPWEFCFAEWNAQFLGDRAFQISDAERANLRWEAKQFRSGKLWYRWDYPFEIGSRVFEDRHTVMSWYLTDNWRAFRTWGLSANSPWEHGFFWKLRDGVNKTRQELPVAWDQLQRPGFSPDYIEQRYERIDLAFGLDDWVPTADGQALLRNNRPLLAYLAGKPARFSSKDHNFLPGEAFEKQLVLINNSRQPVTCECQWSLGLPQPVSGHRQVTVATGQQERIVVPTQLPSALAPGKYELRAVVKFSTGETQEDTIPIHVLSSPPPAPRLKKLALFDPRGETGDALRKLGIEFQTVDAATDLSSFETLIVGRSALTVNGPAPDISRVRDGLKVVVFEQASEVLERRLGFRVTEYGLRQVFPRVPDHPALAGLGAEHLRDWRGAATLVPEQLSYEMRVRYGPTVKWCDIPVTRAWRCGNHGNVASVLIEKPACGDFLPLLDGGFSLQYSPLLEYREGRGLAIFCQLDVTGRTAAEPAADTLIRSILTYVSDWQPPTRRDAVYAGGPAGQRHLAAAGISATTFTGQRLTPEQVLIVSAGGQSALAAHKAALADWLQAGGQVLAIGLDEQATNACLPVPVRYKKAEHIASYFEPFSRRSLLAGVGPADVHNRDPRELPLLSGGARVYGDGVLGQAESLPIVFCQLAPWEFAPRSGLVTAAAASATGESESGTPQYNLRRTFRRSSCVLTRLLGNLGVSGTTPLLKRFHEPVPTAASETRWLSGLYLDVPIEWDDPYRFFRW